MDIDWLANVIRTVDGNNSLGAGALAEAIVAAMSAAPPAESQPQGISGDLERFDFVDPALVVPWLAVIYSEFLPDEDNLGRRSDIEMRAALDYAMRFVAGHRQCQPDWFQKQALEAYSLLFAEGWEWNAQHGWTRPPIAAPDHIADARKMVAALAQQVPADGEWVPEAELLALVAGPYMYHHKMDEAAMREARAFDRCRELTIQNIQTWCAMRRAMLAATPQAPQPVVDASQPQQGAVACGFRYRVAPNEECRSRPWTGAGIVAEWNQPTPPDNETIQYQTLYTTIGQQAVDDAELAEFVRGIYQRMNESYEGGRRILFQDMDYLFDFATKRRIILSQVPAALAAHGKPNV